MKPFLALVTVALVAAPVSAQTYTSRAAFAAATGTPSYTETFESVPVAKDVAWASFAKNGITYVGMSGLPIPNVWVASPGYNNFGSGLNPTASSILTANGDEDIVIQFLNPMAAVGFDVFQNGLGPSTSSFFNGSTLLGSITYNGPAILGFNGYVASTSALITSARFTDTNGGQLNGGVDNLDVVNATTSPEPASIALVATGLLAISMVRRRRA